MVSADGSYAGSSGVGWPAQPGVPHRPSVCLARPGPGSLRRQREADQQAAGS